MPGKVPRLLAALAGLYREVRIMVTALFCNGAVLTAASAAPAGRCSRNCHYNL